MAADAAAADDASPAADTSAADIAAWIAATLDGDDRAFAQLVRHFKERILRLVARFARNRHDLDEVAQDVFVDAHRNLAKFRGDAPFEHWLCRIATRRCQDYLRRLYRRRWCSSLDELRDSGFEPAGDAAGAGATVDPRVELLRLALRQLHPDHQTILNLLELQDCSVREAAQFTGWSEANVKVRAHRARHALRAAMDKLAKRGA
jgi:RNA polymerase sigma-70 factor (ECF subfamily)